MDLKCNLSILIQSHSHHSQAIILYLYFPKQIALSNSRICWYLLHILFRLSPNKNTSCTDDFHFQLYRGRKIEMYLSVGFIRPHKFCRIPLLSTRRCMMSTIRFASQMQKVHSNHSPSPEWNFLC